ncbi:helix-turn-helix domain-containing protein [Leeia aquatica]|uniref:Helix-turn-helix transcriptional regulator n=1 Tax=Leeia aquatica TaxID=2725557 RepID=A0A847S5D5_9NEIS|nr:helix-turn-helix transcriptional regulator [Leeia aquatica]NLR76971.1 helix-turn-helix transcriptional regulator [Leeia aquatica]
MKSIHDERYKQLVKQLISARVAAGVTQTVLSARLGKPQSYVAKVENLERRLDIVELVDWLAAVPMQLEDFLLALPWVKLA